MADRKMIYLDDAIDAVRGIIDDTPDNELPLEDVAFRDGVQYAISVLCNVPSAQPEQSSEIQDILEYLDTVLHPIISPDHWNVYSELHDMISMLPSVQPETCAYWDRESNFCALHRPSAQPEL